MLVRAGEKPDVMHEEDDMTKVRADVLGLAADTADRSIMAALAFVPGCCYPWKSVNEARNGPVRGVVWEILQVRWSCALQMN